MPELPPGKRRDELLKELRAVLAAMTTQEYFDKLRAGTPADRKQAAKLMLATNNAVVELENAELAEIRDKLKDREEELAAATDALTASIMRFQNLKASLDAIAQILGLIGKVVPLVA